MGFDIKIIVKRGCANGQEGDNAYGVSKAKATVREHRATMAVSLATW